MTNYRLTRVYVNLSEYIFDCQKNDVYFNIAKTLIDKISEFPEIFIEEIAFLANTTPASVTKFCKKIGYRSFKELRFDLEKYSDEAFFSRLSYGTKLEMRQRFIQKDQVRQQLIFDLFDQDQMDRIASQMKYYRKIAVLGSAYNFSSINLFRELMSNEDVIVYEVNRDAQSDMLLQIFSEVEAIFVLSLTNDWLHQSQMNQHYFSQLSSYKILLTQTNNDPDDDFDEVVSLNQIDFLFSSSYYSQKVLQSWVMGLYMSYKSIK